MNHQAWNIWTIGKHENFKIDLSCWFNFANFKANSLIYVHFDWLGVSLSNRTSAFEILCQELMPRLCVWSLCRDFMWRLVLPRVHLCSSSELRIVWLNYSCAILFISFDFGLFFVSLIRFIDSIRSIRLTGWLMPSEEDLSGGRCTLRLIGHWSTVWS